jgi:hypothetical protein
MTRRQEIAMNAIMHSRFFPLRTGWFSADARPSRLATMALDPDGSILQLQDHQHVEMRRALGWKVHAVSGSIWITQEGDVRDIVLEPGESFVLDRHGPALLTPLGKAGVCIQRPKKTARSAWASLPLLSLLRFA